MNDFIFAMSVGSALTSLAFTWVICQIKTQTRRLVEVTKQWEEINATNLKTIELLTETIEGYRQVLQAHSAAGAQLGVAPVTERAAKPCATGSTSQEAD